MKMNSLSKITAVAIDCSSSQGEKDICYADGGGNFFWPRGAFYLFRSDIL